MKKHLPLVLILLLAALLRIFDLGNLPISLFGDEVDVGYQAWSLWSTGRDYMGHFLPTYIQSLSEWRAPLLMYLTAPFVGLLGPSAFSIRLPVALLGILNIYLVYLLANKIFNNKQIALLSALFLAIAPWHIHYSRAAFEVTLLLSLLLTGVLLFYRWVSKPHSFPIWPLPFILTFYTYSTANIFTPLLVASLILLNWKSVKIKSLLPSLLYLILLLPLAYHLTLGQAAGRFSIISIFNDQVAIDDIVLQRTDPWVNPSRVETIFHNKPLTFIAAFGRNYFKTFSTDFLFLSGDPLFRHSIGRFGELPWLLAPLLFLGFIYSIRQKNAALLWAWLLLAPIPSALTVNGGEHATRLFVMLPPLVVFSVLGFHYLLSLLPNKFKQSATGILVVLTLLFVAGYWHRYSNHYRFESAKFWHYGYKQVFDQMKTLNPTKRVFINNTYEPSLLRFAYFTKLPPKDFQAMFTTDVPQGDLFDDYTGFKFGDRFYFGQIHNAINIQKLLERGDYYLAVKYKEIPENWSWLDTPPEGFVINEPIKDLNGNPVFYWITAQ